MERGRAELSCRALYSTNYSGVCSVREIVDKAVEYGLSAIALTDKESVYSFAEAFDVARELREKGSQFKLILGMEILTNIKIKGLSRWPYIHLLVANQKGIKNLYKILSYASSLRDDYICEVPKEVINEYREGLLVGSSSFCGEVLLQAAQNGGLENYKDDIDFYDFIEIPTLEKELYFKSEKEDETYIKSVLEKVFEIGQILGKPVVATNESVYVNKTDEVWYRGYWNPIEEKRGCYSERLLSTDEMIEKYLFLGEKVARKVVVDNTLAVIDQIEYLNPDFKLHFPSIPDANENIKNICNQKVTELYGKIVPDEILERLNGELSGIIDNGYASYYVISSKIVNDSLERGYLPGSRGTLSGSLVAYLMGITDINPLPEKYGGYNIPPEVHYGFDYSKKPELVFNIAPEIRDEIALDLKRIAGIGDIIRCELYNTYSKRVLDLKLKSAVYYNGFDPESVNVDTLFNRLSLIAYKNYIHPTAFLIIPDGVNAEKYTPIARNEKSMIPYSLMDYYWLLQHFYKIDLYGHKGLQILNRMQEETGVNPLYSLLDDKKLLSLFKNCKVLGIEKDDLLNGCGVRGLPEYGKTYIREEILPYVEVESISDLIKVIGFAYGTGTWEGNAKELIVSHTTDLSGCISSRDDVLLFLQQKGIDKELSYEMMEFIRKGKAKRLGLPEDWKKTMREHDIPEWYIDSCEKIEYLFPKAHAASYALMDLRILYYKLYYPEAFYKAWLDIYANKIPRDLVTKGYDYVKSEFENAKVTLEESINELEDYNHHVDEDVLKTSIYNQKTRIQEMYVLLEMFARGVDNAK